MTSTTPQLVCLCSKYLLLIATYNQQSIPTKKVYSSFLPQRLHSIKSKLHCIALKTFEYKIIKNTDHEMVQVFFFFFWCTIVIELEQSSHLKYHKTYTCVFVLACKHFVLHFHLLSCAVSNVILCILKVFYIFIHVIFNFCTC